MDMSTSEAVGCVPCKKWGCVVIIKRVFRDAENVGEKHNNKVLIPEPITSITGNEKIKS